MRALALTAGLLLASGCGSSAPGADPDDDFIATGDQRSVETELRRFPGVDVRETPDGVVVRLVATSSFMGDGPPLYVVDGTQRAPATGGALVGIRRADITSIRVLRRASEIAEYGARGANGVVLITTRQ